MISYFEQKIHKKNHQKEKVLVADDDSDLRSLIAEELSEEGFDVIGTKNGIDALCSLAFHDFKLIITDWRMPVRDGIELLASLRSSVPHVPVIFMTAYGNLEVERYVMDLGVKAFLTKPFNGDDLKIAVRKALYLAPHLVT